MRVLATGLGLTTAAWVSLLDAVCRNCKRSCPTKAVGVAFDFGVDFGVGVALSRKAAC